MSIRPAEPGLVINYSYLWWDEHAKGREEGRKDRPCVVVAVREIAPQLQVVTVLPVPHSPPAADESVELPSQLKRHLGLDERRSFILLTETNDLVRPGPDLRPTFRNRPGVFHFGILPPRYFAHLRDRLLERSLRHTVRHVDRDG